MDTGEKYGKHPVNSIEQPRFSGLDGFGLFKLEPFRQPPNLLLRQQQRLCLRPRPLENAVVQTLIQQQETLSFPQEPLDPIASSSAEEKDHAAVRIQVQFSLYDPGRPINPLPQVRIARHEVGLDHSKQIAQHVLSFTIESR